MFTQQAIIRLQPTSLDSQASALCPRPHHLPDIQFILTGIGNIHVLWIYISRGSLSQSSTELYQFALTEDQALCICSDADLRKHSITIRAPFTYLVQTYTQLCHSDVLLENQWCVHPFYVKQHINYLSMRVFLFSCHVSVVLICMLCLIHKAFKRCQNITFCSYKSAWAYLFTQGQTNNS